MALGLPRKKRQKCSANLRNSSFSCVTLRCSSLSSSKAILALVNSASACARVSSICESAASPSSDPETDGVETVYKLRNDYELFESLFCTNEIVYLHLNLRLN